MNDVRFRSGCLVAVLFLVAFAGFAQDAADEPVDQVDIAGVWIYETGSLRWEWELTAGEYEFRAFDGEIFTIGSRGDLDVEDDIMTVVARAVTRDGETWDPVTLDPERATREYHVFLGEAVMRLGIVETPRFFVEYRRPTAVEAAVGE